MPAAELINLGVNAVESIVGLINKGKAKREAEKLQKERPTYSITPETQDELSLAESELSNGMSSRAERAYGNLEGSDFANSLDATLKSGGSVNNIGALYGASQGGRMKMAMLADDIRMKQLNNLIAARRYSTEQKDKSFLYNEVQPWQDKAVATGLAREGADKQIWEGLTGAASGAMQWANNKHEQDMWDKYLNPQQPKPAANPLYSPSVYNPAPADYSGVDLYQTPPILNNQYGDIG